MKFYSYLNEESVEKRELKRCVKYIQNNCKPFLKEYKKLNMKNDFLYSGRKKNFDMWQRLYIRKNRKPRDTNILIHNWIDNIFNKLYGFKARSQSIFCIGNYSNASYYGTPYVVIPIGNYNYIWSDKVFDLYSDILKNFVYDVYSEFTIKHGWKYDPTDEDIKNFLNSDHKYINKVMEKIKTYKSTDLKNAIHSNNEIMLHCDEVVLMDKLFAKDVYNELGL